MRDKITTSKAVFFFCLSFILGIFFVPSSILLGCFFIISFYCFLREKNSIIFCIAFYFLGAFCFQSAVYKIPQEINVPVSGEVIDVSSNKSSYQKIILKHKRGKILFYTNNNILYDCGEVLTLTGTFSFAEEEEYRNYLRKDGIYHVSFYPKIEKVGQNNFSFYKKINLLKKYLQKNLQKSVPREHSSIAEAVILGEKDFFTEELKEKLRISGTSHIVAISGMHIVIFSGFLFSLLLFLGIRRRFSALLSILFISLFVVFVGAPASAVRAGIMGSLLLLSLALYRKTTPLRIVVFTATAMLLFNPFLLRFDLGFQLSFLAVIGIVVLYPIFKRKLLESYLRYERGEDEEHFLGTNKKLKKQKKSSVIKKRGVFFLKKHETIADVLFITISAQIFTFPIILHNFGYITLYSVFANIIIVPLLPFIMIFAFLTATTGFLFFSFFLFIFTSFLLFVISFTSSLPFASFYVSGISPFLILIFYLFIFYKVKKIEKEND